MVEKSVHSELRAFRATVPPEMLRRWESPTGWKCLLKVVQDWTIIFVGHQVFIQWPSPTTFLAALLLISWGQRGLSTLAHDSIHRNLFRSKELNDFVANIALAPPAMSTAKLQRSSHNAHHLYLGTAKDPDHGNHNETSLRHYRNGVYKHRSIISLFLYDVLDFQLFTQSALGSLSEAPLILTAWWTVVFTLTMSLEPTGSELIINDRYRFSTFFLLFHISRCTISYGFYVLREIIDHSGLPQSNVLAFTRSSPWGHWFQKFLQPHDDNYHLLHHLLPKIPMSKLHEADGWLIAHNPQYAEANHYSTYIHGDDALFLQTLHSFAVQ